MKNNRLHFRPAGFFIIALIFEGTLLFRGCEPERKFASGRDATTLEMEATQAIKNMPHKELAALRAYVAPYHSYEKGLENVYVLILQVTLA